VATLSVGGKILTTPSALTSLGAHFILIADTVPPIGHDTANAARRRGHVVRQLCPSLVRVDARDGLEQTGSKIRSANVLDGVYGSILQRNERVKLAASFWNNIGEVWSLAAWRRHSS